MKLHIFLADYAQNDLAGKIHALGVGWGQTQIQPTGLTPSQAVVVLIEVPWDQCNKPLSLVLELVTEDGQPVPIPTDESGSTEPLRFESQVLAVPPPGAPNGSPGKTSLIANLAGGLPLNAGHWYTWRATLDGKTSSDWEVLFYVARQPMQPTFGGGGPVG